MSGSLRNRYQRLTALYFSPRLRPRRARLCLDTGPRSVVGRFPSHLLESIRLHTREVAQSHRVPDGHAGSHLCEWAVGDGPSAVEVAMGCLIEERWDCTYSLEDGLSRSGDSWADWWLKRCCWMGCGRRRWTVEGCCCCLGVWSSCAWY